MKSKALKFTLLATLLSALTACATQPNVQLADNFWQNNKKEKITVATAKAPTPELYEMGNQGLLDYAIAESMNKGFNNYLKTTDLNWYHSLPMGFAAKLKQRNIHVNTSVEQLDAKQSDYAAFAGQTNSDEMLVIKLQAVGAKRQYFAMVPTGAPEAYVVMTGELVNPTNKQVLWRYQTTVSQPVQGNWDQPPNYPNFNSALKLAANSAQQELMDSFFSGH